MLKKIDNIDLAFAGIYFIEQIALIFFTAIFLKNTDAVSVIIGIFPVIFLTTMVVEKILIKADYNDKLEKKLEKNETEKIDEEKWYEEAKKAQNIFKTIKHKWRYKL